MKFLRQIVLGLLVKAPLQMIFKNSARTWKETQRIYIK